MINRSVFFSNIRLYSNIFAAYF